jgi:hypothetical protein
MQEVTKAVELAHEQFCPKMGGTELQGPMLDMMKSAQKWSTASLECFTGEMLRKALVLAAAMADFATEAQNS